MPCPRCGAAVATGTLTCTTCGASTAPPRRFRIDPAAPPTPPPLEAPAEIRPPLAAGASAAPPSRVTPMARPNRADSDPPPAPHSRRRVLMYGGAALALVVLLVAGISAVVVHVAEARYPEDYLLTEREVPQGLRISRLPSIALAEAGMETNPGKLNERFLDNFRSDRGVRPDEGWLEVFSVAPGNREDIILLAFRWEKKEDVDAWSEQSAQACREGEPDAILRDGRVVVVVTSQRRESQRYVADVLDAVRAKAPGLRDVCIS